MHSRISRSFFLLSGGAAIMYSAIVVGFDRSDGISTSSSLLYLPQQCLELWRYYWSPDIGGDVHLF
jgi:hypothetical protein